MFHHNHLAISGGHFTQNTYHQDYRRSGFDILIDAAVPTAFYDSVHQIDAPRCHENTRVTILDKIQDWVDFKIEDQAFMMWLYGAAGAGKSAIARTIAEILHLRKELLATFFFSRGDPSRNNIKCTIATLAYNIAVCVPESRHLIELVVVGDPYIFQRNIDQQLAQLILDPLEKLCSQRIKFPQLIIIDGLDECLRAEEQTTLLLAISSTMAGRNVPIKFLIASRPDLGISTSFDSVSAAKLTIRHSLSDSPQSNADVRYFLLAKFDEIKRTHQLRRFLPDGWPNREIIDTLLARSSGLFIYPATIVKYICSKFHHPMARLNVILGLHPSNGDLPFAQLDALYRHIILSQADVASSLKIIGLCLIRRRDFHYHHHYADTGDHATTFFRQSAMTPHMAEEILCLWPGNAQLLLSDLGALMEYSGDDKPIRVLHASLSEFFSDPSRSGDLHLNVSFLCTDIALYICRRISGTGPSNRFNISEVEVSELIETLILSVLNAPPTPALASNLEHLVLDNILNIVGHSHSFHVPVFLHQVPEYLGIIGSSELQNSHVIYHRHMETYLKFMKAKLQQYTQQSINLGSLLAVAGCSIKHSQRGCQFCDSLHPTTWGGSWPLYSLLGFSFDEMSFDEEHLHLWRNLPEIAPEVHSTLLDCASDTFTAAALRCLRFLRSGGERTKYMLGDFGNRSATSTKHTRPWLWRIRRRRRLFGSTVQGKWNMWRTNSNLIPEEECLLAPARIMDRRGAFFAFRIALHFVPGLLREAKQCPDLRLLAKDFVFAPISTLFPHSTRRVRKAITRFLCHPQPSSRSRALPTNMMEMDNPL